MERQDFLPRNALPGNESLRDLPPREGKPAEPVFSPRMEQNLSEGCGCGDHDGHDGGICVGYEGCGEGSWGLSGYPLAMVYAPCQAFRALYDPATALNRGTLFTELDLPLGGSDGAFTTIGCACRAERRGV